MHIVLLAADGRSPTEISRILLCSRTTVYALAFRYIREGQAAFFDRERRGPEPLVGESASEYIERLVEEDSPTEHGWLRSRWSCKLLAVELFKERVALVSRETLRRVLHRMAFAGGGRALSHQRKTRKITKSKSAGGSKMSFRCSSKRALSSRTRAGWRPTPRSDSAGCAKGPNDR